MYQMRKTKRQITRTHSEIPRVSNTQAMLHGKVADELLPVLLKALYYALACLGDGALAGASRKANGLWPIIFSLMWKELGLGTVRYDPAQRPPRGRGDDGPGDDGGGDLAGEKDLSQGEAIVRWGSRIACLLASVPVHWTVAGAGAQIVSDAHALAMVHSDVLDEQSFRAFVVTGRCDSWLGGGAGRRCYDSQNYMPCVYSMGWGGGGVWLCLRALP